MLLILNIPRLLSLCASLVGEAIFDGMEALPVNTTITSLEVEVNHLRKNDSGEVEEIPLQALFAALPNLKCFKSNKISNQTLLALAQYAPGLEIMETKNFDATRLPEGDIFPNIKKFKANSFTKDMQDPTVENNFATLVAKEMKRLSENAGCSSSPS